LTKPIQPLSGSIPDAGQWLDLATRAVDRIYPLLPAFFGADKSPMQTEWLYDYDVARETGFSVGEQA